MKTRYDYYALHDELQAIERANGGIYLSDMNIDRENLDPTFPVDESADAFWDELHRIACWDAGVRAEDIGLNINALIGRVIY